MLAPSPHPDHRPRPLAIEQVDRAAPVDMPDKVLVEAESSQLAQAGREAAGNLQWNSQLLILLLPQPSSAIVHGDPDPALRGLVFAAPVPDGTIKDQHAPGAHDRSDRGRRLAERLGRALSTVRTRHQARGPV